LGANSDEQPNDHFDIVTYTGNSGTNNITFSMSPDMVWIALRSSYGGGYGKHIHDSTRGGNEYLYSSGNNSEATGTNHVTFQTNGFQTGSSWAGMNLSGEPYVVWGWKANGGTTTTNDASATGVGSIDSVYQANTDAGFSIVTYTGTGSDGTIAHGLSSAPTLIFIKDRSSTSNWLVYHHESNATKGRYFLTLNSTGAQFDNGASGYFQGTAPSTTLISLNNSTYNTSGNNFVAYCWHNVSGYSKFGTYTGNGNDNGPYIHLGFRPKLFVAKRTDSTNDWQVMDSVRNPTNVMDGLLFWNLYNAETSDASYNRDFLSNGVKIRGSESYVNASGGTFIYMAWAEMPEKYSNAF